MGFVGKVCQVLGMPAYPVGGPAGEASPVAHGWASHGVTGVIRRICLPLYVLFRALAAVLPATQHPPVVQLKTQFSGWDKRQMDFLGSV